jgi:hypothetical protein
MAHPVASTSHPVQIPPLESYVDGAPQNQKPAKDKKAKTTTVSEYPLEVSCDVAGNETSVCP